MAPIRTKKRASGESQSRVMTVPTKTGTPTQTPRHNRSPIKKRKAGLTIAQKQALIDNLQLEITERARRLRAQYNLQAQGLRSRVEIRVNRIPISLRKMTMGDLLAKFEQQQQRTAALTRAPPVPAKDAPSRLSPQKSNQSLAYPSYKPIHGYKRTSVEYTGPDKENELGIENPKKRARGANVTAAEQAQILSPTSSNSRLTPRKAAPASPSKSLIARPASPTKPTTAQRGAGLLSSMVEKAKATRATGVRKATTTSTISSSSSSAAASSSATGTTRGRKAGTTTGRSTTTTARGTRRVSASSNASNESTSTVVRKPTRAPAVRKTATATTTSKRAATGAAAAKRTTASRTTTASAPATTRVLRKRG